MYQIHNFTLLKTIKMKIIRILLVIVLLLSVSSSIAFSRPNQRNNRRPVVGAPLDGGLLAVLGIAGVAYFAARNKNRNNPEA
jgi:hypothetical protein